MERVFQRRGLLCLIGLRIVGTPHFLVTARALCFRCDIFILRRRPPLACCQSYAYRPEPASSFDALKVVVNLGGRGLRLNAATAVGIQ